MMAECDPIRYLDRSASSADPSFTATGMKVCRDIRLVHTSVLDALRSGFNLPPTKLREGNVFSHLCPSVSHSVRRGDGDGVQCGHYHYRNPPPHMGSLYRTPQSQSQPHSSLVVTSGGQDWRPVQACLLEDPPPTNQCWYLVAIKARMVGASGRNASYWDAFLLFTAAIGKKHTSYIVYWSE